MKKKLILTICYVLGFVLIAFGTYALLTDMASKNNTLSAGGSNIHIEEDFVPPEKIEAGTNFKKDIQVQNDGPSDCYVRVKVVFTDSDMEKFCTFTDLNTTDWIYNSTDNWYYYTKSLEKDELTSSLFTHVAISDTLEDYQIKDFDILVYAESFQSYGFDNYEDAWEEFAKNKPNN